MATYNIGNRIRVSATFKVSGVDTDPTTVVFTHRKPDGTLVTKTFPTDSEIVKDATGRYHMDISIDAAGQWWYRMVGTGTAEVAEEKPFFIDTTETA